MLDSYYLRPTTINHYQEGYKTITKFVSKEISVKDINKNFIITLI